MAEGHLDFARCERDRESKVMTKTVTVLSGLIRPLVENRLPDWIEPKFFASKEEALELAPQAEIGWFDMYDKKDMAAVISAAADSASARSAMTI